MKPYTQKNLKALGITIFILIVLNVLGSLFFHLFDLTKDKRYTLSETSLQIVKQVKNPLSVKIYMEGDLPADFRRLQQETKQLLEEFHAYNSNIVFEFVNPLENKDESMDLVKEENIERI